MGPTVYYDWKVKADPPRARRLIAKFRALALEPPFDEVSEIGKQDPPDGKWAFLRYDHSFRQGGLPRTRRDARPDFEQLEAKGIVVLRKIAARQRRRKKGSS
jgi:hypothetical protein